MSLTTSKRRLIRNHFLKLLKNKCHRCGSTIDLEMHHINPCNWTNRGSTARCWDLFTSYDAGNIELLCHECHTEHHKQQQIEGQKWERTL